MVNPTQICPMLQEFHKGEYLARVLSPLVHAFCTSTTNNAGACRGAGAV